MAQMVWWVMVLGAASGCTTNGNGGFTGDPFGRPWTFTAVSASISTTQPNGDAWDADSSPPDPFARIYLDGQLVGTTPELQDTFDPVWNYSPSAIVIELGSTLSLDLIDSDVLVDDTVFEGCTLPLTEQLAAAGGATCESARGSLEISVSVE